ncbi:hypothetical protein FKW77_010865 [Venturia effusa]|uniref:Uncharacterized protein n=1 Tax=Venturia effusa TaxID=50376 RepID=A0A517KYN5_9PEZI|nr:hypothetical protein FKW77_010865 [Venturia effusa]
MAILFWMQVLDSWIPGTNPVSFDNGEVVEKMYFLIEQGFYAQGINKNNDDVGIWAVADDFDFAIKYYSYDRLTSSNDWACPLAPFQDRLSTWDDRDVESLTKKLLMSL